MHAAMPSCVPRQFELAVEWVSEAPYTIMNGGRRDWSLLYGYTACQTTKLTRQHFNELYAWIFNEFRSQKIPGIPREPMQVSTRTIQDRAVMYVQLGAVSIPRPPLLEPPGYLLHPFQPVLATSQPASMHNDDRGVDVGEDVAMDEDVWRLIIK